MKKLLFGAVALTMLATASCKKDDDEATGPSNTLTAAGQSYAVTAFTVNQNTVTVTGGSGTTNATIFKMNFGTGTAVPGSGTYKIVKNADAIDEVSIGVVRYNNATLTSYQSQDGSPNLTVTKNGDKMTVSIPNTTVTPMAGMGSDNITISANATQP